MNTKYVKDYKDLPGNSRDKYLGKLFYGIIYLLV